MHYSADISFSFFWTLILQCSGNFDNRKGNGTAYINRNLKKKKKRFGCSLREQTTLTLSPHHTDKAEEWKTGSRSQLFPVEIRLRAPINGPIRLNYQPQWSALLAIRIYLPTTTQQRYTLELQHIQRKSVWRMNNQSEKWNQRKGEGNGGQWEERKENMCHLKRDGSRVWKRSCEM